MSIPIKSAIDMGGLGIVNVVNPSSPQDVATKNYVDSASGSSTLAALTDVLLSTPGSGQVLEYNGTKWVNHSPAYSDLTGTPQLPITLANASHKWLNSYNSATGLFTQTQPDYSDLTSTPTLAQTLINASHKWLNSYSAVTGLFTQTQPDYSDLTGTPQLPITKTAVASNWIRSYDSTTGLFTASQPAYSDITGTPTLAQTLANASHKWFNSYDAATGLFTQTQPDYSDLTGTPTLAQTKAAVTSNWLRSYDAATGLFTASQPAYTDITGTPQLAITKAAVASNWLRSYDSTTGLFTASQPAASDLSNGVTGSGAVVLVTSPTLVTPVLGAAAATSLAIGLQTLQSDTGRYGTGAIRVQATGTNAPGALTLMPSGSGTESDIRLYNTSDPANVGAVEISLAGTTMTFLTENFGTGTKPTTIDFSQFATAKAAAVITSSTTQLKLQETGDALGIINMYLRNRSGSNGAIFENPSVCLADFGMQTSAIITNIAIDGSNNLTVTAAFAPVASSLPSVGQKVTLSGLTTATFLEGQVVTIVTISTTQFTAAFTHALYASAPDTGLAVAQNNVRAEFRNDHVSALNPDGEIQFLDPTSGTPWFASGLASTALTGQLVLTNSSTGILPTVTGRGISAEANVTLGSGTGKAYGVIGVVRGGSDIVGDRAYGGWFKATAQSQTTTEVGIHAEVADVGGMPGEFYASGGLVAQIGSHGTIVGVAGSASFRNTLQLLSDAPRLYFGTGASFTNFKIADQDSVANALEISVGAGGQADPTADTYTAMVVVNASGVRVGTSAPTGFTLGIGGDGSVKSLGSSSQYESNDGTVRGITGVTAFTTGSYNIGTTTAHPNLFFVGATSVLGLHKTATLPVQTNQPLVIAGGFSSPTVAKVYVGDGTGWELDFAKRIASVDTTLFKMKDSGVFDVSSGITIAGSALAFSNIAGTASVTQGGTSSDLSGTGGTSMVLTQFGLGAPITVRQLGASNLSDGLTGSGTVVLNTSPVMGGTVSGRRYDAHQGSALVAGDITLSAGWGASAAKTLVSGTDQAGQFTITANGTTSVNPTVILTFHDGAWTNGVPVAVVCRGDGAAPTTGFWIVNNASTTTAHVQFQFAGTPVSGSNYIMNFICMGR